MSGHRGLEHMNEGNIMALYISTSEANRRVSRLHDISVSVATGYLDADSIRLWVEIEFLLPHIEPNLFATLTEGQMSGLRTAMHNLLVETSDVKSITNCTFRSSDVAELLRELHKVSVAL